MSGHEAEAGRKLNIVGIGGSRRSGSNTERALRLALRNCEELGAQTKIFSADILDLPIYSPDITERTPAVLAYLEAVRRADGVILAAPAYHCGISGAVKNAIDYIQDLVADPLPYLRGCSVGLIATGAGWQGAVTVLGTLRSVAHALRASPTPLGVAINTTEAPFNEAGECVSARLNDQLKMLAFEVVDFAANHGLRGRRQAA